MANTERGVVERVARTLCRLDEHPENTAFEGSPMWHSYIREARAVIASMREPTSAMRATARTIGSNNPTAMYQAMIDCALSEEA